MMRTDLPTPARANLYADTNLGSFTRRAKRVCCWLRRFCWSPYVDNLFLGPEFNRLFVSKTISSGWPGRDEGYGVKESLHHRAVQSSSLIWRKMLAHNHVKSRKTDNNVCRFRSNFSTSGHCERRRCFCVPRRASSNLGANQNYK